jgi:hypothetical protein
MAYFGRIDPRDTRRGLRYPTKFKASLKVGRSQQKVEVSDISRVGALIHGENLPAVGSEVALIAEALTVDATIVWRKADACGLDFRLPIDALEVVRQNMPGLERLRGMRK